MIKWLNDHPWVFSLILVTLVTVGGFLYLQDRQNREDAEDDRLVQCISDWASEFTHRSNSINDAATKKDEAEDLFIRSLATASVNRQNALDRLQDYIDASDHFKGVRKNNPVPTSPKLRCR